MRRILRALIEPGWARTLAIWVLVGMILWGLPTPGHFHPILFLRDIYVVATLVRTIGLISYVMHRL